VLEVAAESDLIADKLPLNDAVAKSLEKSIRSTVDTFGPGVKPPPNQP
jgi:hypothetical protein